MGCVVAGDSISNMAGEMSRREKGAEWWRQRALLFAGGAALLAAGVIILTQLSPTRSSLLFWLCMASAAFGVALAVLGLVIRSARALAVLRLIVINAVVLAVLLGVVEGTCRLAGVDFNAFGGGGRTDSREDYPLCFREPDEPLGEVYFKRTGGVEWTGRPLSQILALRHGIDIAYRDEPELTLRYNKEGFRNPPGLKDWEVVVAGDSFTETGYLPEETIFTSVAAARSGLRIKNLGLCNTGPFTHVEYLKHFGAAPSCKIAVLAFFEGNDINDAVVEMRDRETFRTTGVRPYRQLGPQTSFLKAVYQRAKTRVHFAEKRTYRNATLTAGGKELPITLQPPPMPPDPQTLSPERKQLIAQFLDEWRDAVQKQGMTPWLLYLPINNRTYHGLWHAEPNLEEEAKSWVPNELPSMIQTLCLERSIAFVDAYPALRAAAEQGTLVYNPIFDTHLNAEGSRLVGEVLATALRNHAAKSD